MSQHKQQTTLTDITLEQKEILLKAKPLVAYYNANSMSDAEVNQINELLKEYRAKFNRSLMGDLILFDEK